MKKIIPFSIALLVNVANAECVPARVVVDYPENMPNVGQYARIHPSGNYILVSAANVDKVNNNVTIIDMTEKNAQNEIVAKAVPTPMHNEAYPVEGTWNLIASPYHEKGMSYFKMSDILEKKIDAPSVLNDKDHDQFYHSSAELPGSTKENIKFRTMLWRGGRTRDYSVKFNSAGKVKNSDSSQTKIACENIGQLSGPILSKDGTEVASVHSGNTQIFKIKDDFSCELVDDLGYSTGKVNFSYPNPPSKGKVVFQGQKQVLVKGVPTSLTGIFSYDRDTRETSFISSIEDMPKRPSYPGMTEDGRVIYVNSEEREIVIVDPNQINADGTVSTNKDKCIHKKSTNESGTSAPKSNASSQ